jgi:3-oxoacyl-[acyl-carrier-protein] synthase III
MKKAYIKAISHYLPENILTNEDLVREFPEWSVEKIADKIGINERRISAPNQTSLDLGLAACQKLFDDYGIDKDEVDFLILCTQSPDYFLPTTACIMQDRLGLSKKIGAFDMNLGCSGFVYGLSVCKGLIETGVCSNVLLVMSETYSKFIHPKDKSVRTIFGDGASATLVSQKDSVSDNIHSFVFGTNGNGYNHLIVKNGGLRSPVTEKNDSFMDNPDNFLFMNGAEVFSFTLSVVPKTKNEVLSKANLTADDIDLFILHQANEYMLGELRKKMKIPEEKFYLFLESCGNTVSSTIPIAINEAMKEGKIQKGMKVMIIGFGVGLSWAGAIIEF